MKSEPSWASKVVRLETTSTLNEAAVKLSEFTKINSINTVCIICSTDNQLYSIINHADITRLYVQGTPGQTKLIDCKQQDPIKVIFAPNQATSDVLSSVSAQLLERTSGRQRYTRYVPLVDESNYILDVFDLDQLVFASEAVNSTYVIGLGFVGITLSAVLSAKGLNVFGIDANKSLVDGIQKGDCHVHEPGLTELLELGLQNHNFCLNTSIPLIPSNSFVIVCVGSPIDDGGSPSLEALNSVATQLAEKIDKGTTIFLRSTVPVGYCRHFIAIIEEYSSLQAGKDFYLAFTPERTVEGRAIKELSTLPQIISGYSEKCIEMASKYWRNITDNLIILDSLEEAEMVKLINNSFRDHVFAFSNAFFQYSDSFNIDAAKVIAAANEGYPRNPIPFPSPGVGGYCLSKDPLLYSSLDKSKKHSLLAKTARSINHDSALYACNILQEFSAKISKRLDSMHILVIGLAFKGLPETNDTRQSSSLVTIDKLIDLGCTVYVKDAIVSSRSIQKLGLNIYNHDHLLTNIDAVMILNNNEKNSSLCPLPSDRKKDLLIFDPWNVLSKDRVLSLSKTHYANLGWFSLRKSSI